MAITSVSDSHVLQAVSVYLIDLHDTKSCPILMAMPDLLRDPWGAKLASEYTVKIRSELPTNRRESQSVFLMYRYMCRNFRKAYEG